MNKSSNTEALARSIGSWRNFVKEVLRGLEPQSLTAADQATMPCTRLPMAAMLRSANGFRRACTLAGKRWLGNAGRMVLLLSSMCEVPCSNFPKLLV